MRYPILGYFSPEALEAAASRAYHRRLLDSYVCKDGMCVMAVLLRHDHPDIWVGNTPDSHTVGDILARACGDKDRRLELSYLATDLIAANDNGELRTRKGVAEAFADALRPPTDAETKEP
jgi:hypothetical protein